MSNTMSPKADPGSVFELPVTLARQSEPGMPANTFNFDARFELTNERLHLLDRIHAFETIVKDWILLVLLPTEPQQLPQNFIVDRSLVLEEELRRCYLFYVI